MVLAAGVSGGDGPVGEAVGRYLVGGRHWTSTALCSGRQALIDARLIDIAKGPDGQGCRCDGGADMWSATDARAAGFIVYTLRGPPLCWCSSPLLPLEPSVLQAGRSGRRGRGPVAILGQQVASMGFAWGGFFQLAPDAGITSARAGSVARRVGWARTWRAGGLLRRGVGGR